MALHHLHHQPYDPYYQPQQLLPPLPPPPLPQAVAATKAAATSDWNGINTLFVSGLPDDVKAREIHNLFRLRSGFESCQLKYTGRGNQVVAFATFFSHQSAIAAMHSLNGVKFDPQTGSTLHIELARSNSRRKRKPGSGAYVVIDKRTKKTSAENESSSDDGDSDTDEVPVVGNTDSANHSDSENVKSDAVSDPDNAVVPVKNLQEQQEKSTDGGACSTLFIANLGPNCSEDELKQVLSQYPGFNMLKMRARGGMPVAFADFKEVEQANKVMEDLQDSLLPSSDRGGLHIEYARSKMRRGR